MDDETTMAEAEVGETSQDVQDEIKKLKEESEMSIEELRRRYGGGNDGDVEDDDEAFVFDQDDAEDVKEDAEDVKEEEDEEEDEAFVFDQRTLWMMRRPWQKLKGKEKRAYNKELEALQEATMSIEELRARYGEQKDDESKFNVNVPFLMTRHLKLRSYQRAGLDCLSPSRSTFEWYFGRRDGSWKNSSDDLSACTSSFREFVRTSSHHRADSVIVVGNGVQAMVSCSESHVLLRHGKAEKGETYRLVQSTFFSCVLHPIGSWCRTQTCFEENIGIT